MNMFFIVLDSTWFLFRIGIRLRNLIVVISVVYLRRFVRKKVKGTNDYERVNWHLRILVFVTSATSFEVDHARACVYTWHNQCVIEPTILGWDTTPLESTLYLLRLPKGLYPEGPLWSCNQRNPLPDYGTVSYLTAWTTLTTEYNTVWDCLDESPCYINFEPILEQRKNRQL